MINYYFNGNRITRIVFLIFVMYSFNGCGSYTDNSGNSFMSTLEEAIEFLDNNDLEYDLHSIYIKFIDGELNNYNVTLEAGDLSGNSIRGGKVLTYNINNFEESININDDDIIVHVSTEVEPIDITELIMNPEDIARIGLRAAGVEDYPTDAYILDMYLSTVLTLNKEINLSPKQVWRLQVITDDLVSYIAIDAKTGEVLLAQNNSDK